MRIALFDYIVTSDNAIGKCDLAILAALCDRHEFTVFSTLFENPQPDRIRWVRVPAPLRPLALLYVVFHLLAPLCFVWHRLRHRVRFDIVQVIESNLTFGDIAYSHFCHRAFLERHWTGISAGGLRGALRWLDHRLHALLEPWVYRRVTRIVAPSQGLCRELRGAYPQASDKIRVLANPVDLESLRAPADFDRRTFRENLGWTPEDIVFAFVALGHYERKGLPLLLAALTGARDPRVKAIVLGGSGAGIAAYRERAAKSGLNGNVKFVPTQKDVRPYLWAADALTLPSYYEVFPLVALEAAAAGLPLLVTPLNGVEEFLRDGENGLLMERSTPGVSVCIARFAGMPLEARRSMGQRAQIDVKRYGLAEFVSGWSKLYAEAGSHAG
jgi:glycosyltransferase involved in cell wall biosynthesis